MSGVAVYPISRNVAENLLHQLSRSLTHNLRPGRSTLHQEFRPLDCVAEATHHCWIPYTGLVDMIVALSTIPFTDWTPQCWSGGSYYL